MNDPSKTEAEHARTLSRVEGLALKAFLAAALAAALVIASTAVFPFAARGDDGVAIPIGDLPSGFVPLFNGVDFTGWEGNQEFFRIDESAIIAGRLTEAVPRNEFLCTEKTYGDFELRLQVKGSQVNVNGGIQIRSKRMPGHHEVSGYQVDTGTQPSAILRRMFTEEGADAAHVAKDGRANIWGSLYDESRRNRFLAVGDQVELAKVFKPDDWNDFIVRCEGNRIQIWVNGVQTVDYHEPDDTIASSGIIGLQIHGGPAVEISYRHIVIKELSESRAQ